MHFKQFTRKLSQSINGVAVARQLHSNGHLIEMTVDQVVTIDGKESQFSTIEEARQFIKQQYKSETLEQEVAKELYEELSDVKVANIIKEYHDIKVTDTLIESYIELASSKLFTLDPVAYEIRKLNSLDKLIENKIDYKLNDGSIVAINEATQDVLNNLLEQHNEIVEYMRESKENFLSVIQQIRE